MLLHCGFRAIRPDADPAELAAVIDELATLQLEVEGIIRSHHGPNRDYERKSPRNGYGFVIAFRDCEAHLTYDAHFRHKADGSHLIAVCEGGYEGILVYDLEAD